MATTPKLKAIALMSGGLDSTLAAKLVKDQGIEVVGLHLLSPFGCREDVQSSADSIGISLLYREKGTAFLDLVENPRYGYGKNMNPCIDCRIFMFQLADVVRQDEGADFIVTGEVLGQRPMSQQRHSMALIDRESPIDGLVVRPLSAQILDPSIPEQKGWVDREKFLDISGRSRARQLDLAKEQGLSAFSAPGGGCLLTDAQFSARLRDFHAHPTHRNEAERLAQSATLRLGRHFRLSEDTKAIVSRNETENHWLEENWRNTNAWALFPENFKGPNALLFGAVTATARERVAGMIARYGKPTGTAEVRYEGPAESGKISISQIPSDEDLAALRIG